MGAAKFLSASFANNANHGDGFVAASAPLQSCAVGGVEIVEKAIWRGYKQNPKEMINNKTKICHFF